MRLGISLKISEHRSFVEIALKTQSGEDLPCSFREKAARLRLAGHASHFPSHLGPPGAKMASPPRAYHLPVARSRRRCGAAADRAKKSKTRFARQREQSYATCKFRTAIQSTIAVSRGGGGAELTTPSSKTVFAAVRGLSRCVRQPLLMAQENSQSRFVVIPV